MCPRSPRVRVFAFLSLFAFSGCGPSPILSHTEANANANTHDHVHDHGSDSNEPPTSSGGVDSQAKRCDFKFPQLGACGKLNWRTPPTVLKEAAFELVLTNETSGQRIQVPGKLAIELYMPAMGHGSFEVNISEICTSKGFSYQVSNVVFTMNLDWEIRFAVLNPQGQAIDRAVVKVRL